MISGWSQKMERDWRASARAETWNTAGSSSPATKYMLGIMSKRPCDAVKVVHKAPPERAPCNAPADPNSDCIWRTLTVCPKTFLRPAVAYLSIVSPMLVDGEIG